MPGFVTEAVPAAATASPEAVLTLAAVLMLLALLTQLQSVSTTVLQTYTGSVCCSASAARLFQHLQLLSLSYHDRTGTADSVYRIQYDAMALQYVAVDGLVSLVSAVVTIVAMIYVTARIDGGLALIALCVVPPLVLVSWRYRSRLRSRARAVKQLESGALSVVQEVLAGLRVVKAFGQEDREQERFVGRSEEGVKPLRLAAGRSVVRAPRRVHPRRGKRGSAHRGQLVRTGSITLGALLAVMSYLTQLYEPVKTAAKRAGTLQSQLASAERVFDLLDQTPPSMSGRAPAPGESGRRGDLHRRVLRIRGCSAGAPIGLVPRSGRGPDRRRRQDRGGQVDAHEPSHATGRPGQGQVLLDGVDLRDYRLADLRNQFGVVLQDPVLFSTTIGTTSPMPVRMPANARSRRRPRLRTPMTSSWSLPDGYATQVGERGVRLSGGERQRISLARAFLKDAPVLILDKPTSSVDVRTEQLILDALERLTTGRTSFMISHRPGTLGSCDLVLGIDGGCVTVTSGADAARGLDGYLFGTRRGGRGPPTRACLSWGGASNKRTGSTISQTGSRISRAHS